MIIDLNKIKNDLELTRESLVDPGYFEEDLKILKSYSNTSSEEFDFLSSAKEYLESYLGCEVTLSYTEDGWLKINN